MLYLVVSPGHTNGNQVISFNQLHCLQVIIAILDESFAVFFQVKKPAGPFPVSNIYFTSK